MNQTLPSAIWGMVAVGYANRDQRSLDEEVRKSLVEESPNIVNVGEQRPTTVSDIGNMVGGTTDNPSYARKPIYVSRLPEQDIPNENREVLERFFGNYGDIFARMYLGNGFKEAYDFGNCLSVRDEMNNSYIFNMTPDKDYCVVMAEKKDRDETGNFTQGGVFQVDVYKMEEIDEKPMLVQASESYVFRDNKQIRSARADAAKQAEYLVSYFSEVEEKRVVEISTKLTDTTNLNSSPALFVMEDF